MNDRSLMSPLLSINKGVGDTFLQVTYINHERELSDWNETKTIYWLIYIEDAQATSK